MKESDYILATTIARLGAATDALKFVLDVKGVMTEKQVNDVKAKLSRWLDRLYEKLNSEMEDDEEESSD